MRFKPDPTRPSLTARRCATGALSPAGLFARSSRRPSTPPPTSGEGWCEPKSWAASIALVVWRADLFEAGSKFSPSPAQFAGEGVGGVRGSAQRAPKDRQLARFPPKRARILPPPPLRGGGGPGGVAGGEGAPADAVRRPSSRHRSSTSPRGFGGGASLSERRARTAPSQRTAPSASHQSNEVQQSPNHEIRITSTRIDDAQ
jgi:hypothetical protein